MVNMITMSFCREWKTTSIYTISFHIGFTIEKIIDRNVQNVMLYPSILGGGADLPSYPVVSFEFFNYI
jgi:hypothetical protein